MPSLKAFRNRIASVKATRKITRAMQMVAASKLKRAQDAAQAARPYAEKMAAVIAALAGSMEDNPGAPWKTASQSTGLTAMTRLSRSGSRPEAG